jgi:hypothetical protein
MHFFAITFQGEKFPMKVGTAQFWAIFFDYFWPFFQKLSGHTGPKGKTKVKQTMQVCTYVDE